MVTLLAFIVLIGVLITAHEFGHFIVAKMAGVKVQVFSVGFGRSLVSKTIGETEYRIAMLPLGGYVKLLGMDPDDAGTSADAGRGLLDKPPFVRILIFAAGPAMNLLLPLAIMTPMIASSDRFDDVISSTIGAVDKGLPAYAAGLREGDEIVDIDGEPLNTFWKVTRHIEGYSGGAPLNITVKREGEAEPLKMAVTPEKVEQTDRLIGFKKDYYRIGYQPMFLAADVAIADPAGDLARADGRTFDRVLKVGDTETPRYIDVERALSKVPEGATAVVEVERDVEIDARFPFLTKRDTKTLTYSASAAGPGIIHAGPCVSSVGPETPAGEVLKRGDCILEIDGEAHTLGAFIMSRLTNRPETPKQLTVLRDGAHVDVKLTPRQVVRSDRSAGELTLWEFGLVLLSRPDAMVPMDRVGNDERLTHAWYETRRRVSFEIQMTVDAIAGMFTGRVSPTQLSGPLRIARLAGEHAKAGIDSFLRLLMLLSLSIALLNLLPIPGLDGGQIMVAGVEMIIRRPLPDRVQQGLQMVGVAMIIALVMFALFNDVMNEWRLHSG